MSDNLECTLKINKVIYPQDSYIEPGTWGILSCHPVKVTSGKPILSKYGNFTIKGLLPEINMDQTYKFIGEIYDDDRFDDGKTVITSPVVEFNIKEHFAKTYSGTIYTLGKIDPKYEQWLFETE